MNHHKFVLIHRRRTAPQGSKYHPSSVRKQAGCCARIENWSRIIRILHHLGLRAEIVGKTVMLRKIKRQIGETYHNLVPSKSSARSYVINVTQKTQTDAPRREVSRIAEQNCQIMQDMWVALLDWYKRKLRVKCYEDFLQPWTLRRECRYCRRHPRPSVIKRNHVPDMLLQLTEQHSDGISIIAKFAHAWWIEMYKNIRKCPKTTFEYQLCSFTSSMSGLSALGSPWGEVFGLSNDIGKKWMWAVKNDRQRDFPDDKKLIYQHLLDDMTNSLGLRPFPVDRSSRSTLGTNLKNGS